MVVYWDSAVWLSILNEEDERVDVGKAFLQQAQQGHVKIITSAITLTEVVHIRGRKRLEPEAEQMVQAFFQHPFIGIINVDRFIAENARKLMWRHHALKHKDAIHVATAAFYNVSMLHTYDDYLLKLNQRIALNNGRDKLVIGKPELPFDFPTRKLGN